MSIPAKPPLQATSRPRKRRKLDAHDAATQTSPNVSNPSNKIATSDHSSSRAALLEKQAHLKFQEEQSGHPDSNNQNATRTSTLGRDKPVALSHSHRPETTPAKPKQAQNSGGRPRSKTPPSHSKDLLDALSIRTHTSPDNDLPSPSVAAEMRLRNAKGARTSRPAKHALHTRTRAGQPKAILGIPHATHKDHTPKSGLPKRAGKQGHVVAGPSGYNSEAGNSDASLNVQKRADSPVALEAFRNSVQSRDSDTTSSVAPNHTGKSRPALAGPSGSSSNRRSGPIKSILPKRIQMQPLVAKLSTLKSSDKSSRAVSTASAQSIDQEIWAEPLAITPQPLSTQITGKSANIGLNPLSSSQPSSTPLLSSINPSSSRKSGPHLKWTGEEEQILIECHNRHMSYTEMQHYLPGRSLKSMQHKVARLRMESNSSNTMVELNSESHPLFRQGDSISASVSTQRQTRLPFLPDKGKGRADGKPRMGGRVGFDGTKSSEQFTRTPRHPDVIITVNTRLSQEFLAESIRAAVNGDEEDPIEDDDGHDDANANQRLMEMEDEIAMEDMIEVEKEMSSSRALETTEGSLGVDRIAEEQLGSTIDNAVSISSDSDSLDIYDVPSSPPREMPTYEEVVPAGKNSAQWKADGRDILDGNQEMECMQPWDPAAEGLGYYNHDSEDEAKEKTWWNAVAANVKGVPVPAEFDHPHPSNPRTSRSPVVERIEEIQTADITSHSESEHESDSEDGNTNDISSEISSSSEVSNNLASGASDNSSQSTRAIPDSQDTNGKAQSTPPARSSQNEAEAHKGPVNPFLNAWPNMSKRPQNWHSGMTDSESEDSNSSSDSDNEYELVKKTSKPVLNQNSMLAARHFAVNHDKGGTVNGGEWVIDRKTGDACRPKQNEEMTARTKEEATSEQCEHEMANHIHEVQFANRQPGGDTVAGTNEKKPTKRKSNKERGIHNKEKLLATDQHVHDAVSGNNGRLTSNHHRDKTVTTPMAAKKKSSHHVERGIQTTPPADNIVRGGSYKSTESRKSRARRARRQKSKSRLATMQRTS